jgi:hypothetical protein
MARKIIVSESQITAAINIISEQVLSESKGDVYKDYWTDNDAILTLYCARHIKDENNLSKLGLKDFDELANTVIGSTKHSLQRQIGNIDFLYGIGNQNAVSHEQKEAFEKYHNTPEPELRAICLDIIDKTDRKRVYEEFLERFKIVQRERGRNEQIKQSKEKEEDINKKRQELLHKEYGRNRDISKLKFIGQRPKDVAESINRIIEINNKINL